MRKQPKLIQRSDSPYWFIYVPQAGNRRASRLSTGETDYRKAELIFAQWLLECRKPELKPIDEVKIIDMLVRYQDYKKTESVNYHIRHLSAFFKDCAISHINNQIVREYTAKRLAQFTVIGSGRGKNTVSPSSVRRELGTLSSALNFAKKEGFINEVPWVEKPKETPPRDRWLNPEEQAALINACATPHILAFVMIGLNTGARPSSILELKWFQIDSEAGVIHFNPEGRAQTKKTRPSVCINEALAPLLSQMRKDAKCEYVISFKGKPVRSIKKAFRDACKRAGIEGATPYTLRHTAITMMVRGGVSLALAGNVAGHKDPRTTSRYAKHDPSFTADAVKVLHTGAHLAQFPVDNRKKTQNPANKRLINQ